MVGLTITRAPNAYAALLRDESGTVVGTTCGDTACWNARKPKNFAVVEEADGREHILRCADCPGCREFERRYLCARLKETYAECEEPIWQIVVHAPHEHHALVIANLSRNRFCHLQRAFYRLGTDSLGFLTIGSKPSISPWLSRRFEVTVARVQKSRGKRAWRELTAGMLTPRREYGEWVNRFYHRGLKLLEKAFTWKFTSAGGIKRRHPGAAHIRGWKDGVSVHRPEIVQAIFSRTRKSYELRGRSNPKNISEIVAALIDRNADRGGSRGSLLPAAAKPPPSLNDRIPNRARALAGGEVGVLTTVRGPVPHLSPLPDLNSYSGMGYRGSLQSGKSHFAAWDERMAEIVRKRGKPDDG